MKNYLFGVLAGLGIVTTASAGTAILDKDGPICSSTLCAFNSPGGFYIGGTALYIRPSETGIGMVTDSWQYTAPNGIQSLSKPFDPEHKWAGSVRIGYDIPMSANNVELSYLHLNNDTHAINDATSGPVSFGSVFFPNVLVPIAPGGIFVSNAHLRYKLDQVDLKAGRKYTDMNGGFAVHPSLGLRYANLQHRLSFVAPGNVVSDFDGVGPMLSVDGEYGLPYGFGLVGYFDYAPIVGQSQAHSYVYTFSFASPKRDRIVHSVTTKLGINYAYNFSNTLSAILEAGYQVNEYINAFDIIRGNINFAGDQRITGLETTSFGFRGPYLSLTVHV